MTGLKAPTTYLTNCNSDGSTHKGVCATLIAALTVTNSDNGIDNGVVYNSNDSIH